MPTTRYTVIDGEILSENRNGVKRDYVPDPLGSTIALLDNTQTQTDTFSYYPYGEVAIRTGTTATPFQFVGTLGYYQDNSGRTYVRARHLRTTHGRWMTQDPIGFEGGDFNLYRYVGNYPIVGIDPSGKQCVRVISRDIGTGFRHVFLLFDRPCPKTNLGRDVCFNSGGPECAQQFLSIGKIGGDMDSDSSTNREDYKFCDSAFVNNLCGCIAHYQKQTLFFSVVGAIRIIPQTMTCFSFVDSVLACALARTGVPQSQKFREPPSGIHYPGEIVYGTGPGTGRPEIRY